MIHLYVHAIVSSSTVTSDRTFSTINAALHSLSPQNSEPVCIHLAAGCYREKLTIQIPYLTLLGESSETTKIVYNDAAYDQMPDGSKRGTFRSYTMFIDTHDFTAVNLTIENSAGNGDLVGQAVAVYADGDHICFEHCHLIGNQDTLFTGPLPPAPYEPGGFTGPKEFAPRINGHQYYHDCLISGTVDFIFGSATAYFDHCTLFSRQKDTNSSIQGYVTAASTPEGQTYGYVFHQCHFTGECPPHSVYLGRPWRDYAKTVLLDCTLDHHIHPDYFHDWNKSNARLHAYFALDVSSTRSELSHLSTFPYLLTCEQAQVYTRDQVLSGWTPSLTQ